MPRSPGWARAGFVGGPVSAPPSVDIGSPARSRENEDALALDGPRVEQLEGGAPGERARVLGVARPRRLAPNSQPPHDRVGDKVDEQRGRVGMAPRLGMAQTPTQPRRLDDSGSPDDSVAGRRLGRAARPRFLLRPSCPHRDRRAAGRRRDRPTSPRRSPWSWQSPSSYPRVALPSRHLPCRRVGLRRPALERPSPHTRGREPSRRGMSPSGRSVCVYRPIRQGGDHARSRGTPMTPSRTARGANCQERSSWQFAEQAGAIGQHEPGDRTPRFLREPPFAELTVDCEGRGSVGCWLRAWSTPIRQVSVLLL